MSLAVIKVHDYSPSLQLNKSAPSACLVVQDAKLLILKSPPAFELKLSSAQLSLKGCARASCYLGTLTSMVALLDWNKEGSSNSRIPDLISIVDLKHVSRMVSSLWRHPRLWLPSQYVTHFFWHENCSGSTYLGTKPRAALIGCFLHNEKLSSMLVTWVFKCPALVILPLAMADTGDLHCCGNTLRV